MMKNILHKVIVTIHHVLGGGGKGWVGVGEFRRDYLVLRGNGGGGGAVVANKVEHTCLLFHVTPNLGFSVTMSNYNI